MLNKNELRALMRERKQQFTQQQLGELSAIVVSHMREYLMLMDNIVAYYSLPDEVCTHQLLDELLAGAFELYCLDVPWASDFRLSPKSVLRDMVETASDFKTYIQRYGLARCEGILLRYLADAYRVLDRTIPPDFFDERLDDIVCWLGWLVRAIDSSLFDECEKRAVRPRASRSAQSGG